MQPRHVAKFARDCTQHTSYCHVAPYNSQLASRFRCGDPWHCQGSGNNPTRVAVSLSVGRYRTEHARHESHLQSLRLKRQKGIQDDATPENARTKQQCRTVQKVVSAITATLRLFWSRSIPEATAGPWRPGLRSLELNCRLANPSTMH